METISRRQFLLFVSTSLASAAVPYSPALASIGQNTLEKENMLPVTIAVLRDAYVSEMAAHKHYIGYCGKAVEEKYPNMAYLFTAFGVSEKIHADNFKKILASLGFPMDERICDTLILDTKANLRTAAKKELLKIEKTYPEFLSKLRTESHDQAVINCMYSWKSHKQHRAKIAEIQKYSKMFFASVAKNIEGMRLDFHVCEICGSTIDEAPKTPCGICNYPMSHYKKVMPPA